MSLSSTLGNADFLPLFKEADVGFASQAEEKEKSRERSQEYVPVVWGFGTDTMMDIESDWPRKAAAGLITWEGSRALTTGEVRPYFSQPFELCQARTVAGILPKQLCVRGCI